MRRKTFLKQASQALLSGSRTLHAQENPPGNPPFLTPWSEPPGYTPTIEKGSTPIRLAAWHWDKTTLNYPRNGEGITEMVKRIRDSGYTAGNSYFGRGVDPWAAASESEVQELRAALEEYDVLFFDVHTTAGGSMLSSDPETRREGFDRIVSAFEAAERVGSPTVTVHAGAVSDPETGYRLGSTWTMETWNRVIGNYRELLKG